MPSPLRPSNLYLVPILASATLLAGCSMLGSKPEEPKLEGKRINVTLQAAPVEITEGATAQEFLLPDAKPTPNANQSGGNAAHYLQHVQLPTKVVRGWSVNLGGDNSAVRQVLNPPVIHSGRLFAINTEAEVTALDARSGERLWRIKLPLKQPETQGVGNGLAVQGDLLFVTTGSGEIFALTASRGKKVWNIDLSVPVRAAPTVEGQTLFVTTQDNRLFALDAASGGMLWTHSGMAATLGSMGAAAPAAANGAVIVPYSSGEIFALRATDGRFIWQDTMTSPYTGMDPAASLTSISAAPVVADGLVYAVGMGGGLSTYGLANGQRFWKVNLTTSQQPWVAGLQMFVLTDNGQLAGLNRRDGTIRWVTNLNEGLNAPPARLWVGPVLAGGRLMVASSDGKALSLNPQTGVRLALTDLGSGVAMPPVAADDGLYFQTVDNRIIAFRAPGESRGGGGQSTSIEQSMGNLLNSARDAFSFNR